VKKILLDATDSPFISIDVPVQEVNLPDHKLQFHELTIADGKMVLGLAKRSTRVEARKHLITFADQASTSWNQIDQEMLITMKQRNALARAEEFILSRLIIDHGIPLHAAIENVQGKATFISITHSSSTVAVLISNIPIGIDHELIQARHDSWRRKIDPSNQIDELIAFFQQWIITSRPAIETAAWCIKEATLKVYGREKNIESLPGISIQIVGGKLITAIPGMDGKCEARVLIDQEGNVPSVLAIAIDALIPRDTT
jgi:hypothetical protein